MGEGGGGVANARFKLGFVALRQHPHGMRLPTSESNRPGNTEQADRDNGVEMLSLLRLIYETKKGQQQRAVQKANNLER